MTAEASTVEVVEGGWLRRERAELLSLLRALGDDQWANPTECPAWNAKQVALHVLGDDLSLLSRQRDAATQGLILFAEHHPGEDFRQLLDGFNEQWVTASTFLSQELLLALLELSGDLTATFYEQIDLSTLGEPVGFFGSTAPSPYWQIASREYVERWIHHHQIRRAVDAPDLGHGFLAVAAGVFAQSISLQLGGLGAPDRSAIVIEIPGVASWSLRWDADGRRWALTDGTASDEVARVSFHAATAVRLFSRGPVAAETADVISTSGDRAVSRAALAAIGKIFG